MRTKNEKGTQRRDAVQIASRAAAELSSSSIATNLPIRSRTRIAVVSELTGWTEELSIRDGTSPSATSSASSAAIKARVAGRP